MACENLGRCGCCSKNDNCPYEHYGDGSPFCGEFQCIVLDCKRTICITDEELMDI